MVGTLWKAVTKKETWAIKRKGKEGEGGEEGGGEERSDKA